MRVFRSTPRGHTTGACPRRTQRESHDPVSTPPTRWPVLTRRRMAGFEVSIEGHPRPPPGARPAVADRSAASTRLPHAEGSPVTHRAAPVVVSVPSHSLVATPRARRPASRAHATARRRRGQRRPTPREAGPPALPARHRLPAARALPWPRRPSLDTIPIVRHRPKAALQFNAVYPPSGDPPPPASTAPDSGSNPLR
jgi:hypothetical protein